MKIRKQKADHAFEVARQASATLSAALEGRLAAYALAGAGAALLSTSAKAEVVYTPLDITVSRGILQLDLDGDGITDFSIANVEKYQSSLYPLGYLQVNGDNHPGAGVLGNSSPFTYSLPIQAGQPIGADSPKPFIDAQSRDVRMAFAFCYFLAPGPQDCIRSGRWTNVQNKYLGLKFEINGETHYGWVRATAALHLNYKIPLITARITGYAYETEVDKTITAGDRGSANATADRGSLGSLARGSARRK